MKLGKLLGAIKHLDQVYEGVKNNIWKKDYVEIIAGDRYSICKECDYLDIKGSHCAASGTQPCCANCGCSLAFKTRALSSSCPSGKWDAIMSDQDEKALNEIMSKKK
jgi:RNase P subunit RPR2